MTSLFFKPWSILFGVLGGMAAKKLFTRAWALIDDQKPPKPTERDTSWKVVVPAAALEGAIYAGVKAVAQRSSAKTFEHTTGVWPVKEKKASA